MSERNIQPHSSDSMRPTAVFCKFSFYHAEFGDEITTDGVMFDHYGLQTFVFLALDDDDYDGPPTVDTVSDDVRCVVNCFYSDGYDFPDREELLECMAIDDQWWWFADAHK